VSFLVFFFSSRRRHTRFSRDWSSDVCSSDLNTDYAKMNKLFHGKNFNVDYRILNKEVRALGWNIPPLINAYMGLTPTMRFFGTSINDEFGDVEESCILIDIEQILEDKRAKYIES